MTVSRFKNFVTLSFPTELSYQENILRLDLQMIDMVVYFLESIGRQVLKKNVSNLHIKLLQNGVEIGRIKGFKLCIFNFETERLPKNYTRAGVCIDCQLH